MRSSSYLCAVTITHAHRDFTFVTDRFTGGNARTLNAQSISVSNTIMAERVEIVLQGDEPAEDRGMLYLYPIGDSQYCLQLCYLEYGDAPGDATVVHTFRYLPEFFAQFPTEALNANRPFRFDETTELQFTVCTKSRSLLQQLEQDVNATPLIQAMAYTETAIHLLRRALECITVPFSACQVPACRFLAYEGERDKISAAMRIIELNIDQPHTIKELSRKVAMNECYLKKGFKAITGKTIHEYQQSLRISRAKLLLQEQGRSVTDVANMLGYSSISHFSTAFKKVTGMKPCELLA
jgi:AraC-like DNA-binding protein